MFNHTTTNGIRVATLAVMVAMFAAIGAFNTTARADLIAYWHFNESSVNGSPIPAILPAPVGSGYIDFVGMQAGGPHYACCSTATTLNALPGTPAGSVLRISGHAAVGLPVDFVVSMTGYQDLQLSFATRGISATSYYTGGTWAWATGDDPMNFTLLEGVDTAPSDPYNVHQVKTVDLSSVAAINNADTVILRLVYTGTSPVSSSTIIDNFQINATPIPAPQCPADLTNAKGGAPDGVVDVFDLFVLLSNWSTNGQGANLAPDENIVDVFDLFVLLSAWGSCG